MSSLQNYYNQLNGGKAPCYLCNACAMYLGDTPAQEPGAETTFPCYQECAGPKLEKCLFFEPPVENPHCIDCVYLEHDKVNGYTCICGGHTITPQDEPSDEPECHYQQMPLNRRIIRAARIRGDFAE